VVPKGCQSHRSSAIFSSRLVIEVICQFAVAESASMRNELKLLIRVRPKEQYPRKRNLRVAIG